jgi:2'-5' RNA ligase
MHLWFLAIPLPPKLKKRLSEEADRLRLAGASIIWVKPDHYHVNVRQLGELKDETQISLLPILADCIGKTGPIRLVCKGLVAIPEGERPRLVTTGVFGADEAEEQSLHELRRMLDRRLQEEGFRRSKQAAGLHVNLGRIRNRDNFDDLLERMGPARIREFGHFEATTLGLYESGVSKLGPELHLLSSFDL